MPAKVLARVGRLLVRLCSHQRSKNSGKHGTNRAAPSRHLEFSGVKKTGVGKIRTLQNCLAPRIMKRRSLPSSRPSRKKGEKAKVLPNFLKLVWSGEYSSLRGYLCRILENVFAQIAIR